MKRFFSLSLFFLLAVFASSKAQQTFSATLKPGSTATSVIVAITPNATFTGQLTQIQMTLQVPNTVTPQPTLSIKNNFLSAYMPTTSYTTQVVTEGDNYTYVFNGTALAPPAYNFVAGTEINVLELEFANGPKQTSTVNLVHLADGGSTGQLAFYVEIAGADRTNYTTTFYGPGAVNGGSYSANSFVPLAGVLMPVRWLGFELNKRGSDAQLTWTVSNEENSSHFVIERSENGRNFTEIGKVGSFGSYNPINKYEFYDKNVVDLKKSIFHYRIRQVDLNGKAQLSKVNSLRFNAKAVITSLYPNPARHSSTLTLDLPSADRIYISIVDAHGKVVHSSVTNFPKGYNQHTLNIATYAQGTYDVYLKSATLTQNFKLIKQ